jgi:hypothetical protein
MQAWSPLHTSSSTPYFTRTTRLPRFSRPAIQGLMRRWRSSWHSPSATITFRPLKSLVKASVSVARIFATS